MNSAENKYVLAVIINEGFDYAFVSYDDFEHITDDKFHELRKAYINAKEALSDYVGFKDEREICDKNGIELYNKIKRLPDDVIVRISFIDKNISIDIAVSEMKSLIDKYDNDVIHELLLLAFSSLLNKRSMERITTGDKKLSSEVLDHLNGRSLSLGKTSSGKNVYGALDADAEIYGDFDYRDHKDAAVLHERLADENMNSPLVAEYHFDVAKSHQNHII